MVSLVVLVQGFFPCHDFYPVDARPFSIGSECVWTALRSAALRWWHTDVFWRRHHGGSGGLIEFELALQVGRGSCWQADLVERVDRERLRCNLPDRPGST